ncbi:Integrator complex subunit 3 [Orchesella cincta]|uniref:SOSS complex subunit A homolog n=1 Tax=Orchesella cincta TaxID=48709 RepID=A0A1D2NE56_ORCCI|nr:Integrator complex subunit 3 [Orchesella cincta]
MDAACREPGAANQWTGDIFGFLELRATDWLEEDISANEKPCFWATENMLELFVENRAWLDKLPILIASVIFTYLRILEDHYVPQLASLRQKEVNFVVSVIRDKFSDCVMNPNIGMGRDFLRLLQCVSRIPEIQAIWNDIYYNPKALSPHFTGINQLLNVRTSRRYLQLRLTPEMDKKISFLALQVRFGQHKRYQEWFQRQYLATPESQTLRADIIRFIVGVIHPSNEILCSDILPRWAIIGWLLTTCTNPVAAANAKLALFYDWLVFDPKTDNIMNIEPGILVMYQSMKPHLAITATLLDFLIRLTQEFWPAGNGKIKEGIGSALRTILEKKVVPSLEPLLENPKLEPELRNAIQDNLIVLLHPKWEGVGDTNSTNNVNNGSGVSDNVVVHASTGFPSISLAPVISIPAKDPPDSLQLNYSVAPTPPSVMLSPDIGTAAVQSFPTNVTVSVPTTALIGSDPVRGLASLVPQNNKFENNTMSFIQDEPGFSDEDDDDPGSIPPKPSALAGAVPMRNSPTLGTSVEEAERSKIFELVQQLPTNFRMPLDRMLDSSDGDREDDLDEILEECAQQYDKELRESISKTLVYIYKSELNKPCYDESTETVSENIEISPVSEIITLILKQKPADKSVKSKNLFRLLADIINSVQLVAYKILVVLGQKHNEAVDDDNSAKLAHFPQLYKVLCSTHRNLKLEQALKQDLKACWEAEPIVLGYLCQFIYNWFEDEMQGHTELLRIFMSALDPAQLQEIVWDVSSGTYVMVDSGCLNSVLNKAVEWESWEQHCLWSILMAHPFSAEDYLPVISMLDYRHHAEALTSLLLILCKEDPSDKILSPCLCRKPNPKDRFVTSLLMSWSMSHSEESVSGIISALLVRAYGSPTKRKRGTASGGRGTGSPAGPSTPNVDYILGHLDILRIQMKEEGIFCTDIMLAALLQVQSWATDSQKNKYKDLLALAASEESTDKDFRSSSKRTLTSRRPPSSPTPTSSANSTNSSSKEGSSSSLSRTRSGRTRQTVKDESESSSGDDDEIIPRRNTKKRRKTSALNSDSD